MPCLGHCSGGDEALGLIFLLGCKVIVAVLHEFQPFGCLLDATGYLVCSLGSGLFALLGPLFCDVAFGGCNDLDDSTELGRAVFREEWGALARCHCLFVAFSMVLVERVFVLFVLLFQQPFFEASLMVVVCHWCSHGVWVCGSW